MSMEFIVTFCILSGIGLVLTVLAVAAMLLIKGGIGIAGAFAIGFNRVAEFLHCSISSQRTGARDKGSQIIPIGVFIIIYIAIVALIANVW